MYSLVQICIDRLGFDVLVNVVALEGLNRVLGVWFWDGMFRFYFQILWFLGFFIIYKFQFSVLIWVFLCFKVFFGGM